MRVLFSEMGKTLGRYYLGGHGAQEFSFNMCSLGCTPESSLRRFRGHERRVPALSSSQSKEDRELQCKIIKLGWLLRRPELQLFCEHASVSSPEHGEKGEGAINSALGSLGPCLG